MKQAWAFVGGLAVVGCSSPATGPDAPVATARCEASSASATVTVDVASNLGPLRSLQGFLHGIDGNTTFDDAMIRALRPAFWRFGANGNATFPKISTFGATLTYVISDGYADKHGGYDNAKPWLNWAEYDTDVSDVIKANVTANRPIKYFDIWGEPQGGTKWLGSYDDLVELYSRTITIIRNLDPNAKIVGPSYDNFLGDFAGHSFGDIIVELNNRGKRFDAISWHELGSQSLTEVPAHVATLRTGLATAIPGYAPEIHINEFASPQQHLIPGWIVGWLYYLNAAGVDAANRACWDVANQGSDCWAGLNGLFQPDNHTPQHTYWAHRYYAELVDGTQLRSVATDPLLVGLAVRRPDSGAVRVLTGRFANVTPSGAVPFGLELTGIADGTAVTVHSYAVPATGIPGPLLAPDDLGTCQATVAAGKASIAVPAYPDGAAVYFEITGLP